MSEWYDMWIYLSEVVMFLQRPASFFNFQSNILGELGELVEIFFLRGYQAKFSKGVEPEVMEL